MRQWDVSDRNVLPAPVSEDRRMVWAIDDETQYLIHIGELPASRRGKLAMCTCCYCSASLTAINAAKDAELRLRRPHFRHPKGTERDSCMIVSARHAAMSLFLEEGLIDLPARRYKATVRGLSGKEHHGEFDHAPERVSVSAMRFIDITKAMLTLADGRELLVHLVATEDGEAEDSSAAIVVVMDDPDLATLPRNELRKRIRPLLSQGEWLRCWPQEVTAATNEAIQSAASVLDWWDELEDDIALELRGETLLHRESKRILAELGRIRVPELYFGSQGDQDAIPGGWMREQIFELHDVALEKRVGAVRPDLLATLEPNSMLGDQLLIEITVSNPITEERRLRIIAEDLPCLEIDLRGYVGRVNKDQLADILCHRMEGKAWIHHPRMGNPPALLQAWAPILAPAPQKVSAPARKPAYQRDPEPAHEPSPPRVVDLPDEAQLASLPESDLMQGWFKVWFAATVERTPEKKMVLDAWSRALLNKGINLRLAHDELYGKSLLTRLYQIREWHTEGTDESMRSLAQLVMDICSEVIVGSRQFRPLYLAMFNLYPPRLSSNQAAQLSDLRGKVREDITQGKYLVYVWHKDHDELLLRLFPALEKTISFIRGLPIPQSPEILTEFPVPATPAKVRNSKDEYLRRRG